MRNCAQVSAHSRFYGCLCPEKLIASFWNVAFVKFLSQSQSLADVFNWDEI